MVLYDPAVHPSETGDGAILVQYQTVSNSGSARGYATVGIQNQDRSDGVLYTYYNNYTPGSATLTAGRAIRFEPMRLSSVPTAAPENDLPVAVALAQNFPNPFNPQTQINFSLPVDQQVSLQVYDIDGRLVTTLVAGELAAGHHSVTWRGIDSRGARVSSGPYFFRLRTREGVFTRKTMMVK